MKKKFMILLLIPLFLFSFSFVSKGEETEEISDKVKEGIGFRDFIKNLPEDSISFFEQYEFDPMADSYSPSLGNTLQILFSVFVSAVKKHAPLLLAGIGLVLLFKVLSSLFVGKERLLEGLGYLSIISSGAYSFSVLSSFLKTLTGVSEEIASFLSGALPVLASAQVWSGSPDGASAVSTVLPVAFSLISAAVPVIYTPLCLFCYAASVSGFYRERLSLRPFVQSVKTFCVRGVEILSGLTVGVFLVRRGFVLSSNAMAQKGARFALIRMLPFAGGALTDGLETVYACGKSMCGKTGVICVIVVFSLLLSPCVFGLLMMFFYSVLSSVGKAFGVPLLADFYADMKDTFALLTSFALCSLVVLSAGLLLLTGG